MSTWIIKHRGAPPARFIDNHRCENVDCGLVFELVLDRAEDHEAPWRCPDCNAPAPRTYATGIPVTIVRGNSDFAERQNERLYKRSSAHFKKEGREEAIERQRAQFKREGMVA